MVVQGSESCAMNTLVLGALAMSSSSTSSLYSAFAVNTNPAAFIVIKRKSLPVTRLIADLILSISSSLYGRHSITTMCKFLVFSMIAPFSRTCFVRIPMIRVGGGHQIKQGHFPNISQIKKTISNILIVFFK